MATKTARTPWYRRLALPRFLRVERADCTVRLVVRQKAPLVALGLLLVWYLANPSGVAVMALTTLAGLTGAALAWVLVLARRVQAARRLTFAAVQVGDEMEEVVMLRNPTAVPLLWVEFTDRSSLPGHSVNSVRALGGFGSLEWRAHTICTQRGVFSLGPWEVCFGDPFGLFEVHLVYPQQEEVMVYSPLALLPAHLQLRGRSQGDERARRQPLAAESANAFTARPYQPGDPLHHIHWGVSARQDALYVKCFEPLASSTVWLIADLNADVHCGSGADSTLETGVVLLATLAAHLLEANLAVGLAAHGELPQVVLPQRGRAHLWAILRGLARVQPVPAQPLDGVLGRVAALANRRDVLVVVTPDTSTGWAQRLQQGVIGRGARPAEVFLLDPATFGGSTGEGEARQAAAGFNALGIPARVVRQGDLRILPAAYGALRRWEFTTLGTGRVVVRRNPRGAGEVRP